MRCTALGKAEFNRAHLTADTVLNDALKHLARACEILVAENVHSAGLSAGTDVLAVCKSDTLGYRYENSGMLLESRLNVVNEALLVKYTLGKVYKVGTLAVFCGKSGGSGKPACISAHDLDDSNRVHSINVDVAYDLADGGSDELGCTAESGSMVGSHKVVVNSLGNTYYAKLVVVGCRISRKLENGIHRIIAADIEEISDIVLFEDLKDLVIGLGILLV